MLANFRTLPASQPLLHTTSQPPSRPSSAIPTRRTRAFTEPTPVDNHTNNTHAPPNFKFTEIQTAGSLNARTPQSWRNNRALEMPTPFPPIRHISGSLDKGSFASTESISRRGHHLHHHSNRTLDSFRQAVPSIAENQNPDSQDIVYTDGALSALPENSCEDLSSFSEKSDEAAQIALKGILDEMFAGFVTPANEHEMETLKNTRLEAITRRNIGPEEFKQRVEKMENTDDLVALVSGSASALGFILGYYAFTALNPTLENHLSAKALPYAPGGITGAVDCYLRGLLERMHTGYYTSPDPAALENVMQDFLAQHGRPLTRKLLLLVGALSPYTMRNLIRSLVAPLAAHFGLAAQVDLAIDNFGGFFFSGPAVQHLGSKNDQQDHLKHPALFFSRTDWESQFEKLGDPGYRRFARFLRQACKGSIQLPNMLLDAGKELFTVASATEVPLLMVGFAFNTWIKEFVRETYGDASPEAVAFVESSAGTTFLATLYCSLSFAMAGVKELKIGANRLGQKLTSFQPEPQASAFPVRRVRVQPNLPERY